MENTNGIELNQINMVTKNEKIKNIIIEKSNTNNLIPENTKIKQNTLKRPYSEVDSTKGTSVDDPKKTRNNLLDYLRGNSRLMTGNPPLYGPLLTPKPSNLFSISNDLINEIIKSLIVNRKQTSHQINRDNKEITKLNINYLIIVLGTIMIIIRLFLL